MRRVTSAILIAVVAAPIVVGCDSTPPTEIPEPPTQNTFVLHSDAQGRRLEFCSPKYEDSAHPLGTESGTIQLDANTFTLAFIVFDTNFPDTPRDTLRVVGSLERYDPLILMRTMRGDTLFATVGPTPDLPTTVTLYDPFYHFLDCPQLLFVTEGYEPNFAVNGGDSDLDLSASLEALVHPDLEQRFDLPHLRGVLRDQRELHYRSGMLSLDPSGQYDFELEWSLDNAVQTDRTGGRYTASGPLVLFDPASTTATFGVFTTEGMHVYRNNFRLPRNTVPSWGTYTLAMESFAD